ncbi:Na/Pi symporter [Fervidibacillus halotolerans]|uniref:Na/Pi symporter n=1 Tax=Fervidibacillus halotolerans TaxID=2980027 RepID=A0A9E8RXS4_9BACI|nr:Na/Pi symporter [Fervidibacillus halotolerans]WAA11504.1 Na/Pi symporter [Fervidibacillus halotolerans]
MFTAIFFLLFLFLFLGGLTIMRTGLMNLSGNRLKKWLLMFTSTPWKGMLFGIFVTVLLQSSSAVMIIVVGLISANLLTFRKSIGIILGTNIGTTATIELLAFGTEDIIFPFLIIGSLCLFFSNKRLRSIGLFFLGVGFIFFAMAGFERLAKPLANTGYLSSLFVQMNEEFLIATGVGAVVTALIQSSTAMTGIAIGLLEENILSLKGAIAVMLGSNIGTCLDTLIAGIVGGKEARLTAYAHIWLNVFGVVLFLPILEPFAQFNTMLSPFPDQQLAHASFFFNLIVSLLVLPFSKPFSILIEKVHGLSQTD